jgi:hypothetical protein
MSGSTFSQPGSSAFADLRRDRVNLAASTRNAYRLLYAHHLEPYLGSHSLRDLTVDVIARWQADRLRDGVGPTAVRKSLVLLSGILQTPAIKATLNEL